MVAVPIEEEEVLKTIAKPDVGHWKPKTTLGRKVKDGDVKDITSILDNGQKILEAEIVDALFPDLQNDLLLIGQAKGKFGGGQRRVFRQTQKKTNEGNKPHFGTLAVAGNGNGYVGVGYGKSKETVPAREKALRKAKLNIIKIRRGCGSWQCFCKEPHSIPYQVAGKCGSVTVTLIPAPKGTGLRVDREVAKVLRLAGVRDVWSHSTGQTRTKLNLIHATMDALLNAIKTKVKPEAFDTLGVVDGRVDGIIREKPKEDEKRKGERRR
ncbi:30S ribosomal protein S5 [Candidatus Woesearchaeota archaeon]|nr:30S ribosomal protein S5 [Candidatus Woesearchaeota archaeon]